MLFVPLLRRTYRLDPASRYQIEVLMDSAARIGLPPEALLSKTLEGISKGAPGSRIVMQVHYNLLADVGPWGAILTVAGFYAIFATLILAGAAFAAFNLTGRMVEAQRREIGVGTFERAIGLDSHRFQRA